MKINSIIQLGDKEILVSDIEANVKEKVKETFKVKDLQDIKIYVKLEEAKAYYVATCKDGKEEKGSLDI